MAEGPRLEFFASKEELARFAAAVTKTYLSMLEMSGLGGLSTGDWQKAALLSAICARMCKYKMDRAAEMVSPELKAKIEREAEALWPMFKDVLETEIAEAADILKAMHERAEAETPGRTH
jgi:hypothetical protein